MSFKDFYPQFKKAIVDIKGLFDKNYRFFSIEIVGRTDFISKTKEALELLREKMPDVFDLVIKYISGISQGSKTKIDVDVFGKGWCFVGESYKDNSILYAASLAHEAYHCKLFYEFKG